MSKGIHRLRKRIPYSYWLAYDGIVLSFLLVAVFFDVVEYLDKRAGLGPASV